MSAQVILRKYTGKDGTFGTLVSSLGIKRVDTCVPSVYSSEALGGKTIPANDASDARMYCVYAPDSPDCTAYSMECVFKIHLLEAPDTQLSNIRIYPVGEHPKEDPGVRLNIGCSLTYSQPTNARSQVATDSIWQYSKENPFYVTIGGVFGQTYEPEFSKDAYSVEFKDYGHGNVAYLDGIRQPAVPVGIRTDIDTFETKLITFTNNSFDKSVPALQFIDREGNEIPSKYVTINGDRTVLSVTEELVTEYPTGIRYRIPEPYGDETSGYNIVWVDLAHKTEAVTPEIHDVEVIPDPTGHLDYYIDGVRAPQLNFEGGAVVDPAHYFTIDGKAYPGYRYIFRNHSGREFPMRFVDSEYIHSAVPGRVVTDGIAVLNGGTDDEIIMVNPEIVFKSGIQVRAYRCVCREHFGNTVFNKPLFMCGQYNMCRVGGGVYNPKLAGETDYIYLQLEVPGNPTPGYTVPQLMIEYDEN